MVLLGQPANAFIGKFWEIQNLFVAVEIHILSKKFS